MADAPKDKPLVENRWWAEIGKATTKEQVPVRSAALPGSKFFKIADGYDQDRARDALTDQNLRLLNEAHPSEGEWGYLSMIEAKFSRRELERIKRVVDLPPYARGVVIDSGRTIRLLVTGTPIGERVLELALVDVPSFDCWIKEEWVREKLFRDKEEALGRFRQLVRDYLSPEAIAEFEATQAQA